MEQALTHPSRPNPGPAVNRLPSQPLDSPALAGNALAGLPSFNGSSAAGTVAASSAIGSGSVGDGPAGESFGTTSGQPGVFSVSATDWGNNAGANGSDGDELDPETPGRSPRRQGISRDQASQDSRSLERLSGGSDPLGEGLGLLAGLAIGLLTLVVPLLSVISDRGPGLSVDTESGSGRPR